MKYLLFFLEWYMELCSFCLFQTVGGNFGRCCFLLSFEVFDIGSGNRGVLQLCITSRLLPFFVSVDSM